MAKPYKDVRAKLSERVRRAGRQKADDILLVMRLEDIRKKLGITQTELAARMGVTQPEISRIENLADYGDMHLRTFLSIIHGMECEVEITVKHGDETYSLI